MGIFERYLSVWVALCITAGVVLGNLMPGVFHAIAAIEYGQINLVVALLIWLMIYPMMVQIDFGAIKDVSKKPKGIMLTLVMNWLVKPFTMAALGWLFFKVFFAGWVDPQSANEYIAGMILLGVAPCTAMVFVWSQLTKGDANYTLVQVSVNDIIMIFAFAPPSLHCCWASAILLFRGKHFYCQCCYMCCCHLLPVSLHANSLIKAVQSSVSRRF